MMLRIVVALDRLASLSRRLPRLEPMVDNKKTRSKETLAYIALGSNLGDARKNVLRAIERLQSFSERPPQKSSLWKTTPVDCPPDSADFVNAVVGLVPRAQETPESLLKKLQTLEKEFGRTPKKILNEPRPLDLDLIAFGQECRTTADLVLPHPRAHQRRFVLQPLAEIAPDFIFPGQSNTVLQLLNQVSPDEEIEKLSS
jgi:2-amino-4-hydroxy-6-hydroxymethyldihydropteridine diphosphokinase